MTKFKTPNNLLKNLTEGRDLKSRGFTSGKVRERERKGGHVYVCEYVYIPVLSFRPSSLQSQRLFLPPSHSVSMEEGVTSLFTSRKSRGNVEVPKNTLLPPLFLPSQEDDRYKVRV